MTVIQLSRPGGGAGSRPGGGTSNRPRPTAPTQPPRPRKALLDTGWFRRVLAVAAAIAIVTGFSAPLVGQAWTAELLSLLLLAGLLPLQLLVGELLRRSLHMSRPGLGAAAWEPCPARVKQESHGRSNGRGSRSPTRISHSTKGRVEMTNVPNAQEVAVSASEPTPAPRAEAFGLVTAGIRVGGLPIPEQVMMHDFRSLILLVNAEDPAAVDRWATYLGLARPRLDDYVHTTGTRRWKTYGVRGNHPRLAGWDVTVYCTVTEPAGEQAAPAAPAVEQLAGAR